MDVEIIKAKRSEDGKIYGDAVAKAIDELANSSEVFAEPRLKSDAVAALSGLGPLEPFMQDPQVEEIWMNKPNQLFVHRQGKTESHDLDFSARAAELARLRENYRDDI